MAEVITCNLEDAKDLVIDVLKGRQVLSCLISSPGMGKSSPTDTIAKHFNLKYLDVHMASQKTAGHQSYGRLLSTEVRPRHTVPTSRLTSSLLKARLFLTGTKAGVLGLDEFNSAPRQCPGTLLRGVLWDHAIGGRPLPKNVQSLQPATLPVTKPL